MYPLWIKALNELEYMEVGSKYLSYVLQCKYMA